MGVQEKNVFLNRESVQIAYFKGFQGHIHNPGMGIIAMAVSDHMVTGYSPEERAAKDKEAPFTLTKEMLRETSALSYIDNLYIRVGWKDVQQQAGRLTFSKDFRLALEAAREAGLSWGLRIMQASPSNPEEHLIPEFLADKLPLFSYFDGDFYGPRPQKLPLYTEEYLKYWDEMLQLLGDEFDQDPLLEYADVSGYGLWGEGHHGCQAQEGGKSEDLILHSPQRAEEVVGRLIASHRNAFPATPAVLNLTMSCFEAGRAAIEQGSWVRRDSYYNWFQAAEAQAGLLRRPDAAMIFETVMPGVGMQDHADPAFRHSFLDTPDAMCDYGANYGIVGFNPLDTLYADHMYPQLFEHFSKRLGYRLRPSIVWKVKNPGGGWNLVLGMVNDGCANPPGEVHFCAESSRWKGRVTVNGSAFQARMHLVELPLPAGCGEQVRLTMRLTMGTKTYPVCFAVKGRWDEAPYELWLNLNH